jgi:hypothetical protein
MSKPKLQRPTLRAAMVAVACHVALTLPPFASALGSAAAQPARASDDEMLRKVLEDADKMHRARSEGRGPKHPDLPRQDPCALLTTAEVGAAVKGAGAGQRDHFNEEQGVARCVWRSANGAPLLKIELVGIRDGRGGSEDSARSRFPGAQVRKLAIGEGGLAYHLPRDTKSGLPRDMATAGTRAGKVEISVSSDELARKGAAPAMDALEALLKRAVARL